MIHMIPIKRLAAFMLICMVVSCTGNEKNVDIQNYREVSLAFDKEIQQIIDELTLEEKVAMLHGNGKFFSAGIERFGIPEVQYTDGPLGIREEIERGSWNPAGWTTDSATFFPASVALAATWNLELARQYGEAIGQEARARNKDILLAPAINIIRTPLCGRNYEYFTEDPYLNASLAVSYVQGAQKQDIAVCVKHYAMNNQETNRATVDVNASERALREIYLAGFKAAVIKGQALTVMGAYNRFRGDYLCENDYMLNKILKGEWGFKGAVISDWAAVHSTIKAAKNGLDIEMGTEGPFENYFFANPLIEAVKKGEVDEELIDDKVRRILRVLYNCRKTDPSRKKGSINTPEHSVVAYQVAAEAVVLLKNNKKLLPIDTSRNKSIAVIGDNATMTHASGGFGAGVKARYEVTLLEGLKNRLAGIAEVKFAQGYKEQYVPGYNDNVVYGKIIDHRPDMVLIDEAVKTARECDMAVIAVGTNRRVDSEGADRIDLKLPFGQDELIRAVAQVNPNTVVVVVAGGPFDLTVVEQYTSAIVWTWFNGSEGGNALADVLTGTVNPSGKLPYTIPGKLEDSPPHTLNAFPGDSIHTEYKEDILVGYRWFDTKNIEPMYCFGHGLSYTQFSFENIKINKTRYNKGETVHISVILENTGERPGAEVVQVYVHDLDPLVPKPLKELKAFKKVFLEPGQKTTAAIDIAINDLAYYDEINGRWVVEPGEYALLIGSSSRDIRGKVTLTVQ